MYNPIRPLMFWWNGRNMNKYLEKELEKRFASVDGEEKTAKTGKQKHVIDLALETYIEEEKPVKKQGSDETFKKFAIDQ